MIPWEISIVRGAERRVAKISSIGWLVVRWVRTDYEVSVFGVPMDKHSRTMEDGVARAEFAARKYVREAMEIVREDGP